MANETALGINASFVKAASLLDLIRAAYQFTNGFCHIYAIRQEGHYRLVHFGERLGKGYLAIYSDVDRIMDYITYNPTENERFEMRDSIEDMDYQSARFHIIRVEDALFSDGNKIESLNVIKLSDHKSLVRLLADGVGVDDYVRTTYAFVSGDKRMVGTFEAVQDGETTTFVYAESDIPERGGGFFRYSYKDDRIDVVGSVLQNTDLYIKIVNLAEPLPFLTL